MFIKVLNLKRYEMKTHKNNVYLCTKKFLNNYPLFV